MKANVVSPTQPQPYSASYDLTTKIISAAVCALLVAAAFATGSVIVAGLGALFLMLSYAYSPRGYVVSGGSIVVRRFIGDVRIPLDDVREIRAGAADDFLGCIRLLGNGGLFGYYGLFRTSKLGKCSWYVTSRTNPVVIVTASKTLVLSPDDVDGFVTAVRASAPVQTSSQNSPSLGSRQSYGAGNLIAKLVGATVGIAVISVVAFAMMYSPGPPSYTLTQKSLTIHDRFYAVTLNAADVNVEQIRIVDFRVDANWRPTARTNGFANSHYHSGWFRVANGQSVRMYWADGKRLVLLPPRGDGAAVLLETKEPEKFVDEVQQAWSSPS